MGKLIKGSNLNQKRLYRITNENEIHNGFQYQTGKNTDHLDFNPTNECQPGGLYFFDIKYIIEYENSNCFGHWIRKVTLEEDEDVWDEENGKFKAHSILLEERIKLSDFEIPKEFRLEAFSLTIAALTFVKDREFCLEAVKQKGYALAYVTNQDKEICLEAVKQNGYVLYYVENQDREICLAAVKQFGLALQFVKKRISR